MRRSYQASPALLAAILAEAPAFRTVTADKAPSTLAQVVACFEAAVFDLTPFPVFADHSTGTIWPDANANHAFRAFHDRMHYIANEELNPPGERATAIFTERFLRSRYTTLDQRDYAALWFEVVGQAAYYARNGRFPTAQAYFIQACFDRGIETACRDWF